LFRVSVDEGEVLQPVPVVDGGEGYDGKIAVERTDSLEGERARLSVSEDEISGIRFRVPGRKLLDDDVKPVEEERVRGSSRSRRAP